MEKASCLFCGRIPSTTTTTKALALSVQKSSFLSSLPFSFSSSSKSICLFVGHKYNLPSTKFQSKQFVCNGIGESSGKQSSSKFITPTKTKPRRKSYVGSNPRVSKSESKSTSMPSDSLSRTKILVEELGLLKKQKEQKVQKTKALNVTTLYQNGDPLGRRDLGKKAVRWISEGMKAMASDFVSAELQGEFLELRQRMGPGLTFVIQAQPYLSAIPIPLGLEAICLKACTHYPTLFDHFQRELRNVLQELHQKSMVEDWKETESWKLLKELANSAQHRAIARKNTLPKPVQGVLGMDLEKAKAMQRRIDEFTKRMSELLQIERDAELEFTQEELDAVPTPDEGSDPSKPIEFLVSHGQAQQELCDTICNLNAVSTSTGLGGMYLVLFRVEGNHRLPPTTLSPGDMVCVRISDSRGAGATSCIQGFVDHLGDDGCSISVAMESRHGV